MKSVWPLLLVLGTVGFAGCISGRNAGRADARRDLSKGVLGIEAFGRHTSYVFDDYYPLLRERYGIRVTDFGCLVDDRTIEHVIGYNEIMDAEMARRFGTNYWRQALESARQNYESKQRQRMEQQR